MSDSTDIDELLEHLNNTLTSLDKYEDIDTLIDKVDGKNRKQLKKIKSVVLDINNKISCIKDKVSKAYKKVKVRSNSESNESTNIEDVSDKEVDSLVSNGTLEASIEEADRFSPVIGGKKTEKSTKVVIESESDGIQSEDKGTDGGDIEKQVNEEIQRDHLQKSSEIITNLGEQETEQPTALEEITNDDSIIESTPQKTKNLKILLTLKKNQDITDTVSESHDSIMQVDEQDTEEKLGDQETEQPTELEEIKNDDLVIESTPQKTKNLKLLLTLKKNQDKTDTVSECHDSIMEVDEQQDTEENSEKSKKNKDKKKETPYNDKAEKSSIESDKSKEQKKLGKESTEDLNSNSGQTGKDNETEELNIDSKKSKKNNASKTENVKEPEKSAANPEQDNKNESKVNKGNDTSRPKIKVIDIAKLLPPKTKRMEMTSTPTKNRKSVTFDSSVIVLSSSDEDTPKKSPIGKENDSTPLKSALRKTTKNIELSDSDSKENDENLKNKKMSSEGSDMEDTSSTRRLRRRNREVQERFSKLRKERVDKEIKKSANDLKKIKKNKDKRKKPSVEESLSDDNSDKEKSSKVKTSKKNKGKRKKDLLEENSLSDDNSDRDEKEKSKVKTRKRNKDKKKKDLLEESSLSDDNSDNEEKEKSSKTKTSLRNKKNNKKDLLEESSLSEDENSVIEENEKSSKKRTWSSRSNKKNEIKEADINDPKFKMPVIIRLPKYNSEELPKIYQQKKELLEIKKFSNIKLIKSSKKPNNLKEVETSNDEKQENKRIKLTLKINKKNLEKEGSSDSEHSSIEDNGNNEMDNDGTEGMVSEGPNIVDMEDLATSCLDQVKDSDDEQNRSNSDEEETKKKKDKNNKKDNTKEGKDKDEVPKLNGEVTGSEEEEEAEADKKTKRKNMNKNGQEVSEKKKLKKKCKNDEDNSGDEEITEKRKKGNEKKKDSEKNSSDEAIEIPDSDKESDGKNKNKSKTIKLSSDSDDDFATFSRKKDKSKSALVSEAKKRMKKKTLISDSESTSDKSNDDSDDNDSFKLTQSIRSESDTDEEKVDKEENQEKSKPRKRIKRVKDSSSDDDDRSTRKHLRKMIDRDSLSLTTQKAEAEEKQRKARIAEKQTKYNKIFELKADATVDKVVLDFDEKTDKPLLSVHRKIVKHLKPHQVHGVKFMWDACFESLSRAQKTAGSGCILAHCMGLGKTLQVIALAHTLLTNQDKTKVERIMIVCPLNTVINWKNEFKKWMPKSDEFDIYELVSCKTSAVNQERNYIVKCWHEDGGILIIGYNMFRNLSNPDNKTISKKLRESFQTGLVDPGPDLVVCDEGHLLKNEKTNLSIAMNRIKTSRRIVLTGTPLQNNLREYWCMVQFIKPNLLGTYKEYLNRFVNPITNGQYTDSTQHDIMIMRRRSHVLHKLLDGVVQRQDYDVLAPYLPPKYEYVLFVQLTEIQTKLYQHYMDNFARKNDGSNRTSFLFTDFQEFQRICTHPRVLLDKSIENKYKKEKDGDSEESEGSIADFIDDDSESASSTPDETSDSEVASDSDASTSSHKKKKKKKADKGASRTRLTRAQAAQKREAGETVSVSENEEDYGPKQWWEEYIAKNELDNINHSSKLFLLFELLKECEEIGDKILVFSQSLYTLNCIEYFLAKIDEATQKGETEKVGGHSGSWALGLDYFRLDGSSSCDNRANWCDEFNNPENIRARLFLISTKAGGLGINLVAANRVIIFDVSWNPSHDIQSIYRVYRFGQTKPSYIYRFVTHGTMEMKIYERQVTKQAISKRVIDEQQIDRHYSQNDIQELYKTDLKPQDRPIPLVPKDVLLGEMLQKYEKTIYKYHEHQSLLENKQDEELNEEERKAAWDEFENEKVIRKTTVANFGNTHLGVINNTALGFSPHLIQMALGNIVRKDNPSWSDVQIKGILPALVTQLQVQMSENDFSMYNRVFQEIRLMQSLQAQRMREQYLKQYQMQQLLQKQQISNQMLGSLQITPEELRLLQMAQVSNSFTGLPGQAQAGGSGVKSTAGTSGVTSSASGSAAATSAAGKSSRSSEVIELVDE